MQAGAVSMVRNVKNPISLARYIMENTNHVLVSGNGALELAKNKNIELEADAYLHLLLLQQNKLRIKFHLKTKN